MNLTTSMRLGSYIALSIGLVVLSLALRGSHWHGGTELHSLSECSATLLALFVGTISLAMYRANKDRLSLLIVGVGFLGAGILDGYHGVVTSSFFIELFPSSPPSLSPWSWHASRTFLSVFMCLALWITRKHHSSEAIERYVYGSAILLTTVTFLFFAVVPLPIAYYGGSIGGRPQEYIPGGLFLIAIIGHLRRGAWKTDMFDYWFVMFLVTGFITQVHFMSQSHALFDCMFDVAHLLKIISYFSVAIGITHSMSDLFRKAKEARLLSLVAERTDNGVVITDSRRRIQWVNDGFTRVTGYALNEVVGRLQSEFLHGPQTSANWTEPGQGARSEASVDTEVLNKAKCGREFWSNIESQPICDEYGQVTQFISIQSDITQRKQDEEERDKLRQKSDERRAVLDCILQSVTEGIVAADRDGNFVCFNQAAENILGEGAMDVQQNSWSDAYRLYEVDASRLVASQDLPLVRAMKGEVTQDREILVQGPSESRLISTNGAPLIFGDKVIGGVVTIRDITQQRRADEDKRKLTDELLNVTRQAGMAEVATGILHNVGNVLNSVNVGANVLERQLDQSSATTLTKAANAVSENESDLASFFETERGRQFPRLLRLLSTRLEIERRAQLDEVQELSDNVNHIKEIITMQQSYAMVRGTVEEMDLAKIVQMALKMHDTGFARHGVKVVCDFEPVPPITTEKHKVLQIIVNLISNAKNSLRDHGDREKHMVIGIRMDGETVCLSVKDNGIGIPKENLTKIFSHGFTTRKDGHGFGLHSSTLAAQELGGSLSVQSDGLGCGATFSLRIPMMSETTCEA